MIELKGQVLKSGTSDHQYYPPSYDLYLVAPKVAM